jgi:predicted ribosomally synthesized peptide with SipW-like signal peptide
VKKILTSLMAIGIAAVVMGIGTFAYFSDPETASATISAGIINLQVNGNDVWSETYQLSDIKPCRVQYINLTLHLEEGTNPARIWFHIKNVADSSGETSDAELEADPSNEINDISDQILVDLFIRYWICGSPPDGVSSSKWIIEESDGLTLKDLECQYINLTYDFCGDTYEVFDPCHDIEISISFHLKGDTGNEYQGDTTTFDIEFYAEQADGPGPQ